MKPNDVRELNRNKMLVWLSDMYRDPLHAFVMYRESTLQNYARYTMSLLSRQSPVKPVRDENLPRCWVCGKCGTYIGFDDPDPTDPNEYDNFCRKCGHPVLWEKEENATESCKECKFRTICEELEYPMDCEDTTKCDHYNAFLEGLEASETEGRQ